jgi:hypothetical protein
MRSVFLILSLFLSAPVWAQDVPVSDGDLLGIVMNGRSAQLSTKQTLYKLTKLFVADELYKKDKMAAIWLLERPLVGIGPNSPSRELQIELLQHKYDRKTFLHAYSDYLDGEIKGANLGDLPAGKVIKLAASGVAAAVSEGVSFIPKLLLAGTVQFSGDQLVDKIIIKEPMNFDSQHDFSVFELSSQAAAAMENDRTLAPYVASAFRNYAGIVDFKALKNSSEYKTVQSEYSLLRQKGDVTELGRVLSAKLDKVNQLEKQNHDLLLEVREWQKKADWDEERRQQLEAKRKELQANIEAIDLGFSTMSAFARAAGAGDTEVRLVDLAGKMSSAIMQLTSTEDFERTTSATSNAYFTMFTSVLIFAVEEANKKDQVNPMQVLMEAIVELGHKIDRLRDEMIVRFQEVDGTLAREFARQEHLSDIIIDIQKGNTQQLNRILERVDRTKKTIIDVLNAYDQRNQDVLIADCLSSQQPDSLNHCKNNAYLQASKWSYEYPSVESDFSSVFGNAGVPATQQAVPVFLSRFAKVLPLYAKTRFDGDYTMPNPEVWSEGSDLLVHLFLQQPSLLRATSSRNIDETLRGGRSIQTFFRELFTTPAKDGHYKVDPSVILTLADDYAKSLKMYLSKLQESAAKVQVPWNNPKERLPEEASVVVSEKDWGDGGEDVSSEHIRLNWVPSGPPNAKGLIESVPMPLILDSDPKTFIPWEFVPTNLSNQSNAHAGRGKISQDDAKKYFKIAVRKLQACPDMSANFKLEQVSDWDRGAGDVLEKDDIKRLRSPGFDLDSSILPLIPREALWLERMDPKYTVNVCVSGLNWYSNQSVTVGNYFYFDYKFRATLRFTLTDPEQGNIVVGYAKGGVISKVRVTQDHYFNHPGKEFPDTFFSVVTMAWVGYKPGPDQMGPIQNNIDKYFVTIPASSGVAKNLTYVREKVQFLRSQIIQTQFNTLVESNSGPEKSVAEEKLRILQGLQLLGADQPDEIAQILVRLREQLTLLKPSDLPELIRSGVASQQIQDRIDEQVMKLRRFVSERSGRELEAPITTPVDYEVSALQFLKDDAQKREMRAR